MTRRGISVARHKASPEHPSRSRRWRHWQWKVELWLKIERLRKNSFKSTDDGGDDAGRWGRRERGRVAKGDRGDLPAWNIASAASDSYMTFPKGMEESPRSLSSTLLALALPIAVLYTVSSSYRDWLWEKLCNPCIAILIQHTSIFRGREIK